MLNNVFNRTETDRIKSKPVLILGFRKNVLIHNETEILLKPLKLGKSVGGENLDMKVVKNMSEGIKKPKYCKSFEKKVTGENYV